MTTAQRRRMRRGRPVFNPPVGLRLVGPLLYSSEYVTDLASYSRLIPLGDVFPELEPGVTYRVECVGDTVSGRGYIRVYGPAARAT